MGLLFDSHCHLESDSYDSDIKDVISRTRGKLSGLVCSGVDLCDFDKALALHDQYDDFVHLSLGIHPGYADKVCETDVKKAVEKIKANRAKIVALGEVGLEYYWQSDLQVREKQKQIFIKFIRLARELDLPLVAHIRNGKDKEQNAYEEAFEILENEGAERVLLHMFGSKSLLSRAIDNGWYISTNAICQSSKEYKRVIRAVPLENLMLETDSPSLVPEQIKEKGIKRNEPVFIEYVAERVAGVKELSFEQVCAKTSENAKKFFGV